MITLNSECFLAGIIFIGAAIFNLIAIYIHGAEYNQISITEFMLGRWPANLGLTIILKYRSV